uniref:Uncharacterized protein n=1 Tax=viral metagenome TaxID=1070528 RepID=A0A6C0IIJ2_9ZZZZ
MSKMKKESPNLEKKQRVHLFYFILFENYF